MTDPQIDVRPGAAAGPEARTAANLVETARGRTEPVGWLVANAGASLLIALAGVARQPEARSSGEAASPFVARGTACRFQLEELRRSVIGLPQSGE